MLRGKTWKFGDHIDTDIIIPARYLNTTEPVELARHCMEGVDPEFAIKLSEGDIIVAGENFGCGSSREHAPLSIKALGVSCVIAKSFARIFFRNAINIGLPIAESREVVEDCVEGDMLAVDFTTGTIVNERLSKTYTIAPFPQEIQKIINAGGLMNYISSLFKPS